MATAIGLVLLVAGAGVSHYGSQKQAKAVEKTAAYNARLERNKNKADVDIAAENMRRQASINGKQIAAQRAAIAGSGISVAGTPLAVLGETQTALDQHLSDLSFDSRRRTKSSQSQQAIGLFEGRTQASSIRTQASSQLVSSVVSGASSYGSNSGFFAPRTT